MEKLTLKPTEMSHRSGDCAVSMTYMIASLLDTYSHVMSKHELFHLQMHVLYAMIDIIGAHTTHSYKQVLTMCERYFEQLEKERGEL